MARTDYGAILSTVIKDTSDAIREVNDTSALIAPNAWGANIRTMHSDADYENALSYIPTKTVSGAIASFNDGAGGLDLKSLKVAINATQSGSGDPYPAGGGAQKWDEEWELGVYDVNTGEKSPATTRFRSVNRIPILPNTNYYCKASHTTLGLFYDNNGTFLTGVDGSANYMTINSRVFLTPANAYYMTFFIAETTYNHDIAINYPSSVTTYSPYSNIRPIIGVSECNLVNGSSINMWDEQWEQGGYDNNGEKTTASVIRNKNLIPVRPNTTYYFYRGFALGVVRRVFWDENMNCIYSQTGLSVNTTFTTPNNAVWFGFNTDTNYGTTYRNDISINNPPSETGYNAHTGGAYTGNTYTIQLGDTYYGGSLDVTNGVLTVVKGYKDLGTLAWTMSGSVFVGTFPDNLPKATTSASDVPNVICSQYAVSSSGAIANNKFTISTDQKIWVMDSNYSDATTFKTAMSGVQLVYELATPITVQLTPTQVEQLLGANNVWADTGDVEECVYYSTASGGATDIESVYQRVDTTGINTVPATLYTFTATEDCFLSLLGTCVTDTGSNQGFIYCTLNGTRQGSDVNLTTGYETSFNWDLHLQSGDEVSIVASWSGSHSYCYYNLRLSQAVAT